MLHEEVEVVCKDRRVAVGVREKAWVNRIQRGYRPVIRTGIWYAADATVSVADRTVSRELGGTGYEIPMYPGGLAGTCNVYTGNRYSPKLHDRLELQWELADHRAKT